jgi:hypothetical protein
MGTEEAQQLITVILCADAAFRSHHHTGASHFGRGGKLITNLQDGMHCQSGMFHAKSKASEGLLPFTIADAETGSAVEATKDAIYLTGLIKVDFGIELGSVIELQEDNAATVNVSTNLSPKASQMRQSAHKISFLRSAAATNYISMKQVPTGQQAANQFTKGQGAVANTRDLSSAQGDSPLIRIIQNMARIRYLQRHRLPTASELTADDNDEYAMGAKFVQEEAAVERESERIMEELVQIWQAHVSDGTGDDNETISSTTGDVESKLIRDRIYELVKSGLGEMAAMELVPEVERSVYREEQARARLSIDHRKHDQPRWHWMSDAGTRVEDIPVWQQRARADRSEVATSLLIYACPTSQEEERMMYEEPSRLTITASRQSALRGGRNTEGSTSASATVQRRSVRWRQMGDSVWMPTEGHVKDMHPIVNAPQGSDMEGVDMPMANVEELLDDAVLEQNRRANRIRRFGGSAPESQGDDNQRKQQCGPMRQSIVMKTVDDQTSDSGGTLHSSFAGHIKTGPVVTPSLSVSSTSSSSSSSSSSSLLPLSTGHAVTGGISSRGGITSQGSTSEHNSNQNARRRRCRQRRSS